MLKIVLAAPGIGNRGLHAGGELHHLAFRSGAAAPAEESKDVYKRQILSCGLEILLAALSVILVRRLFKNAMSIASMPELMNPSMPDSRP